MAGKLESNGALKGAVDAVLAGSAASSGAQAWYKKFDAFLQAVEAGVPNALQDRAFLQRLWDEENVSATGNGTVKIAPALDDAGFRAWFAAQATQPRSH